MFCLCCNGLYYLDVREGDGGASGAGGSSGSGTGGSGRAGKSETVIEVCVIRSFGLLRHLSCDAVLLGKGSGVWVEAIPTASMASMASMATSLDEEINERTCHHERVQSIQ